MKRLLAVGVASFCLLSNLGFAEAAIEIIESRDLVQTQISEAQAKEIALKQVKGTVIKVELETEIFRKKRRNEHEFHSYWNSRVFGSYFKV